MKKCKLAFVYFAVNKTVPEWEVNVYTAKVVCFSTNPMFYEQYEDPPPHPEYRCGDIRGMSGLSCAVIGDK